MYNLQLKQLDKREMKNVRRGFNNAVILRPTYQQTGKLYMT